jgi:aminopeptidase N
MTAITDRIYDLGGTLSGTPNNIMLESTIAHEAGHQWFYNMVGNDQLDDPWLDESLVQYITWGYYANQYGADGASGFEASLRGRWARVENAPIPIGLPVADYQGREYGAIVYGRGAFFFEALKEELGEEAFQTVLYDYAQSNMWGIGTPAELQTLAEEKCDCDLSALFDEWVNP